MDINRKILEYLKTIPKWKVTTYKRLSEIFWVHPRKIAQVMRYNKHPDIYPCYKVVSASLDVGWYSALAWVESKIEMLKKDWIKIENGKILPEYILR